MSKLPTLFLIALLLCSTLTYATRSGPAFPTNFPGQSKHTGVGTEKVEVVNESCEGVGEEECLMRRTLAAHIDYIYTQKEKP